MYKHTYFQHVLFYAFGRATNWSQRLFHCVSCSCRRQSRNMNMSPHSPLHNAWCSIEVQATFCRTPACNFHLLSSHLDRHTPHCHHHDCPHRVALLSSRHYYMTLLQITGCARGYADRYGPTHSCRDNVIYWHVSIHLPQVAFFALLIFMSPSFCACRFVFSPQSKAEFKSAKCWRCARVRRRTQIGIDLYTYRRGQHDAFTRADFNYRRSSCLLSLSPSRRTFVPVD